MWNWEKGAICNIRRGRREGGREEEVDIYTNYCTLYRYDFYI